MKASEVRSGNLIKAYNKDKEIIQVVDFSIITILEGIVDNKGIMFKPIHIDEDILNSCGFISNGGNSQELSYEVYKSIIIEKKHDHYNATLIQKTDKNCECDWAFVSLPEIKSVHELQNVYYFLFGKELNVSALLQLLLK